MSVDDQKRAAAQAALDYIEPGCFLGIGTGSTTGFFIRALAGVRHRLEAAVASSEETRAQLEAAGITVLDLNAADEITLYVDSADEADHQLRLVKGGGGALTREKIIAEESRRFVCIADESKLVETLGAFPLPVEVIPMARSLVARKLVTLGGIPEWRQDFATDNGNVILDVRGLDLSDPAATEARINQLPGVVTVGLFAGRGADLLLLGTPQGVKTLRAGGAD